MSDQKAPAELLLYQAYEDLRTWQQYAWSLEASIEKQNHQIIDLASSIALAQARAHIRKHRHLLGG